MKNILKIIGIIILFFYSLWAMSFVTSQTYYWFIYPLIKGMPLITLTDFMCIKLFISCLNPKYPDYIKDEYKENWSTKIISSIIIPWIFLFFIWLFKIIFI